VSEEKSLTVGQYLRKEREGKGISLADVAKVTRITLQNLEALERDEFHAFPAPFFARGFLRTYALHLGLDPNKILAMFEAQTEVSLPAPKVPEALPSARLQPLIYYLLIVGVIVVAAGLGYFHFSKAPIQSLPPSADRSTSEDRQPGSIPEKRLEPVPAAKPPETEKQVVRFKAIEKCWIRFKLDDQPAFDILLQPGETITRTAIRQIQLTIGNAGGVEGFFNEKPLGPLGRSGQVVHLLLPEDLRKKESLGEKTP